MEAPDRVKRAAAGGSARLPCPALVSEGDVSGSSRCGPGRCAHPGAFEQLGFKQQDPLAIGEARASASKHRTVRAIARLQVHPRIQDMRDAHGPEENGCSVVTYPSWCLHFYPLFQSGLRRA